MGLYVEEPARRTPAREFDVVVAGGGTAGVVAALAAARQGARTALVESKGYPGGLVAEGGTALHSFFNLWKPFGVEKRQVVRGIPEEIVQRLTRRGGTAGHMEVTSGEGYDCVCTNVDTELYKLVAFEMLREAGVHVFVNTWLAGALREGGALTAAITESHTGREALLGRAFVDATGYGDLSRHAGAAYAEPNDHPVANSMGVGGVDIDGLHRYLESHGAVYELCRGEYGGRPGRITRLSARMDRLPQEFVEEARAIDMSVVTTTLHEGYFMFVKLNVKMPVSPTDRDGAATAELELRLRQEKAIGLIRRTIPGCERAFIARTSPSLCIRRGRQVVCDYDVTKEDVLEGRHFSDDVMAYGFHDMAPRYQVKDGGTYGIPYRALCVKDVSNLLAAGMIITSDFAAHMSTRNTVCCMGQGQAAGTAAALAAAKGVGVRDVPYAELRKALERDGVYFE